MMKVAVNGRFQGQPLSGVQRYATEITRRLENRARIVPPPARPEGVRGHWWEQAVLPRRLAGDELLWSPGNTGPLRVARQVVTIHDWATLDHPEWFNPRFAGFYGWLLPRLIRRVRAVICVSAFTRARMTDRFPGVARRVEVVRPGVDARFTRPAAAELRQALAQWDLEESRYVLCVSSFEPRKNQARLVEAWEPLAARFGMPLVLAGHSGRAHIFTASRMAASGGTVRLLPNVPDAALPALYSGAVALIFPSLYEGFGLPMLEAAACGTPVIASRRPAMEEAMGAAAQYCDPANTESIRDALFAVLSSHSLRVDLAARGRERVRLFTWDRAAAETWDILQSVAAV
ncbi:MAG: glycosyltransferase family 4 protein [Bryobacterales bacterium]|nr:glycosyltransferase family 4 protein [Bryobacterales bacterium]